MTPITVALTPEYNEIWQTCCNIGHEMIITTKIRRIFPTMEFQIRGLEQNKSYKLSMHFEHVDNLKYRYDNTFKRYTSSISHESKNPPKIVSHLRGTQTGSDWMSNSISFDNVRITCTKKLETESENYVHLLPGHRYQPVLTVYESDKPVHTSRIEHMVFIASTQYHGEIGAYKRSINKYSPKSEAEQKVGILGKKRSSAQATLESSAKQSRSQNDNKSSNSGAGTSGAGTSVAGFSGADPPVAIPLKFGAAPSFDLSLGASFNSGSHLVVLSTPPISPADDPVAQKFPEGPKTIKSEVPTLSPAYPALPQTVTPPITPESISIFGTSTPEAPNVPGAVSPESKEPGSIKLKIDTPSAAASPLPGAKNLPISPEIIEVEVSERPSTPEMQVIQEAAPDAPPRPVRIGEPRALRPPTPVTQNIQQQAPRAPYRPARPVEVVPLRELFPGLPMMPIMPMMPFGMLPYPINWNPMVFPVQPPVIPEPVEEENDEAEVEFIDIIN